MLLTGLLDGILSTSVSLRVVIDSVSGGRRLGNVAAAMLRQGLTTGKSLMDYYCAAAKGLEPARLKVPLGLKDPSPLGSSLARVRSARAQHYAQH